MRKGSHIKTLCRLLCIVIVLFAVVALGRSIVLAEEAAPAVAPSEPSDDCAGDSDCDGVPDDVEVKKGTDAQKCDTDGDGLSDGVELGYIQPVEKKSCHGLTAATTNDRGEAVGTNFKKPHFMDPQNPDSDGDGLKDGEEDKNNNGWIDPDDTDPSISDTDDDDISDYVEVIGDFDGDGFPDFDFSIMSNGPRCNPPASMSDLDCDGIPSARDDDSDNDGCPDKSEGEWVDSNSNGIPDLFDSQAKSCPDQPSPGSSSTKPQGPKKEEDKSGTNSVTHFAGDAADGGACALAPSVGDIPPGMMLLSPFLVFTAGLALAFLRHRQLHKRPLGVSS